MGPIVRIFLRYLAGVLVAKGVFSPEDSMLFQDPQLEAMLATGLGLAMSAAAEYYYVLAKKFGWDK